MGLQMHEYGKRYLFRIPPRKRLPLKLHFAFAPSHTTLPNPHPTAILALIAYSFPMEIHLAALGRRNARRNAPAEQLLIDYRDRIGHFCRCEIENYLTEEKFFAALERGFTGLGRESGRGSDRRPQDFRRRMNFQLILLDSRGRSFSSEQFAAWLRGQRDQATPRLVFAIGPADGWSDAARTRAGLLLSLGAMTLPHELAAVVLAEQIYRAFTILEGHPYHLGHAE